MWSYLKADLEELVSVVKEDTNVVMEKMADDTKAKKQSAAVKEARRRAGEAETYTVPLLVSRHTTTATTTPNSTAVAGSAPNEEEEEEADDADADDAEPVDAEEARRVAAFLQSLHLVDRADEIDRLLRLDDGGGEEEDETRIGAHYAALVPDTISPDEFWQRYYYRCDAARIAHDWADADERHRQARAALVGTVSNFFGAAAHAVAASVGGGRADPDHAPPAAATTRGLHGLFGGSAGRPPFVMNTALDEDGDDDDNEEEEEEEEELGWDDDDEDEEVDARNEESSDVVNSSSVGGNEEQIEFKDEALDAVKEQLKQAIEERDLLHQTVALQSKEIASLKTGGVDPAIETLEPMRVALEEKDTEFASVMQALEREMVKSAASEEQSNKLQAQVVHLTGLLAAKETPPIATQDATTASTSTSELEDVIRSLQNENELLRQKLNEGAVREATTTEQLASLQDEVVLCRANIAATAAELDATRARLAATQSDAAGVQAALDRRVRAADDDDEVHHHQQQGAAAAAAAITDEDAGSGGAKSAATMDTTSTGDCVKVTRHRTAATTNTTPSSVVSTRAVGDHDTDDNGEAEEGWGDDWD